MNADQGSHALKMIACDTCKKVLPMADALAPEVADYVVHFCGTDCYETWVTQREAQVQPDKLG